MGRRRKQINIKSDETRNFFGIITLIISALIGLSIFVDSPGLDAVKQFFGNSAIIALIFSLNLALRLFKVDYLLTKSMSLFGQFLLVLSFSGFMHYFANTKDAEALAMTAQYGGVLGFTITHTYLIDFFAKEGAFIILIILLTVSVSLSLNQPVSKLINIIVQFFKQLKSGTDKMKEKLNEKKLEKEKLQQTEPEKTEENKMIGDLRRREDNIPNKETPAIKEDKVSDDDMPKEKVVLEEDVVKGALVSSSLNFPDWKFPPSSLLTPAKVIQKNEEGVKKNADIIEQTLQSFGVKAKVVDVIVGPSVTQYAINIALGTKASRIVNLKTDLALALAAPTGAVRIEAPIPGTSYIGIEIPNDIRETVYLREVVESKEFDSKSKRLPLCVGKSINGKGVIMDLQKMPHLLVAGATGSGKSVLMHSFLATLLMTRTPDEVRFIMVDPKQVELYDYNGIPHLLTPVITDTEKVLNSLKWAIIEMERRYTIFRHARVRDISLYNDMMGFPAMPYIIIVIDEMADLMLSSGAETESAVVRLAQKARATGIHLILATQRPSVDVITGLIKANIPARVGMSVATQIDSRVILDQIGAETLLGNGDLLMKQPDMSKPLRIQGPWVSQDEIKRIVKFIKSQVDEVEYKNDVTEKQEEQGKSGGGAGGSFSDDELFADAVRIVCNSRKGSASLLQRKLSIGYNRAARLLDELFEYGVVGPEEGSRPRKVLISDAEGFLAKKGEETTEDA